MRFKTHISLTQYLYDTIYAEDEEEAIKCLKDQYRHETNNGAVMKIITVRRTE